MDGDNSCLKGLQELLKADIEDTLDTCCKDGTWCDLVAGKDDKAINLKCVIFLNSY